MSAVLDVSVKMSAGPDVSVKMSAVPDVSVKMSAVSDVSVKMSAVPDVSVKMSAVSDVSVKMSAASDLLYNLGFLKIRTLQINRSQVYLACYHGNPFVKKVLKVYENEPESLEVFKTELSLLQRIQHPNIIPIEAAFKLPFHSVIVMPFCEWGALTNVVGRIDLSHFDHYFLQLCSAIKYLHGQGIAHRDIKLDNILLDAFQRVYITDFDLSCTVEPENPAVHYKGGTFPYMAPEMLAEPDGSYDGFKIDMFAFGVVNYAMLFQQVIIEPEDYLEETRAFPWPEPMLFHKAILENLLLPDPGARWGILTLIENLSTVPSLAERAKFL
ncbi:uncharacterized protein LOC131955694 [Physella acuta]|uniref:uncharacterized protein LOC131955694 n=1 Tax=Physella acuta TaxID=109671 RepID=UPI0027DAB720|nr:uncharacterized protein LOC131955694 [Physella acuta]